MHICVEVLKLMIVCRKDDSFIVREINPQHV